MPLKGEAMYTNILKHLKTVTIHKYYVFIECCKMGIPLQGILHDLSKFDRLEFMSSAKYWRGNGSPIDAERAAIGYSYGWLHHKGKNKHHWQWYVDIVGYNDDMTIDYRVAPMPNKYILEMYCDMVGAAKAYKTGTARDYYMKHYKKWILHPITRKKLEKLLKVKRCKNI